MKAAVFLWMLFLSYLCLGQAHDPLIVRKDGSIEGKFACAGLSNQPCVLRFGLPAVAPEKTWREGAVVRTLWITNNVRYTETVFVTEGAEKEPRNALIVNVEGDNTSREYVEAMAQFSLEVAGQRQDLELTDGLVWRRAGDNKSVIGAFEISDSGVVVRQGPVLRFRGNMPPSLKGSMTLKIALTTPKGSRTDWLEDLEYERELRRLISSAQNKAPARRVVLEHEFTPPH